MSPQTRQRVLEAAHRLDFRPNALAQFFATGRSRTIGILAESASGTFTMPVLVGAVTELGIAGLASVVLDGVSSAHVDTLRARSVDGVLVIGSGSELNSMTDEVAVPVAYAFGSSRRSGDVSFLPDSTMAGRLAGEHLIATGRKRVAHITAARDVAADDRIAGISAVLHAARLAFAGGRVFRGDWSRHWGVVAARQLVESGAAFDAVFCGNDAIAQGVLSVLRDRQLRVPEDIALVGVDHWPAGADLGGRWLTTVDPELRSLGAAAAQHLLSETRSFEQGSSPAEGGTRWHPCSLVVGGSTDSSVLEPENGELDTSPLGYG